VDNVNVSSLFQDTCRATPKIKVPHLTTCVPRFWLSWRVLFTAQYSDFNSYPDNKRDSPVYIVKLYKLIECWVPWID